MVKLLCSTKNSKTASLAAFLSSMSDFIYTCKSHNFKDNLLSQKRKVLREIQNWKDKSIVLQDKGSRFIIMNNELVDEKILVHLNNRLHYSVLPNDPSITHNSVIKNWANKWFASKDIDALIKKFDFESKSDTS